MSSHKLLRRGWRGQRGGHFSDELWRGVRVRLYRVAYPRWETYMGFDDIPF